MAAVDDLFNLFDAEHEEEDDGGSVPIVVPEDKPSKIEVDEDEGAVKEA